MSECAACGEQSDLQEHHLSYGPEVTVRICSDCHSKVHGHGTGVSQDLDKERLVEALSYDGLSTVEMAAVLECSKGTVRKYRKRADADPLDGMRETPERFKPVLEAIEYKRGLYGVIHGVENFDKVRSLI